MGVLHSFAVVLITRKTHVVRGIRGTRGGMDKRWSVVMDGLVAVYCMEVEKERNHLLFFFRLLLSTSFIFDPCD